MPRRSGPRAGDQVVVRTIRKHQSQEQVVREAKRYNVLSCGRRWGKTSLEEDRIIRACVQGFPCAWTAPEYQMLDEPMRDLMERLGSVITGSNMRERRIEIAGGGTIDFFSLDNPKGIRGRKFKVLIVDEAAYVKELIRTWNFVLRPTLADMRGDAWFGSTPSGINDFHTLWSRGNDGVRDWASWIMPTSANPYIAAPEIEDMRESMGEIASSQELDAKFLDLTGAVFRNVRVCATEKIQDGPTPDGIHVAGIDLASTTDWTVIKVLDISGPIPREVYTERWTRVVDWGLQIDRLRAVIERFSPVMTVVDRTSHGDRPFQELAAGLTGVPIKGISFTHATKAALVQALALAFEKSGIRIIDDPSTIGELIAYEAKKTPTGLITYGAAGAGHDDNVSALYLAYHAYGGGAVGSAGMAPSAMGDSRIARLKGPAGSAAAKRRVRETLLGRGGDNNGWGKL